MGSATVVKKSCACFARGEKLSIMIRPFTGSMNSGRFAWSGFRASHEKSVSLNKWLAESFPAAAVCFLDFCSARFLMVFVIPSFSVSLAESPEKSSSLLMLRGVAGPGVDAAETLPALVAPRMSVHVSNCSKDMFSK